jgi:predicted secreted protein
MTTHTPMRMVALGLGVAALAGGGMLLAGCGDEQVNQAASTAPDGIKTYGSGDTHVDVARGAKFVISLPETAGTGYRWNAAGGTVAGMVVQLFDDAFVPDNPDLAGSSGVRNFTYDTAKAGTGTLSFTLLPPGSTAPDDAVTFQVAVR